MEAEEPPAPDGEEEGGGGWPMTEVAVDDALRDMSDAAVAALETLLAQTLEGFPAHIGGDDVADKCGAVAPADKAAMSSVIIRGKRDILQCWEAMLRSRWELVSDASR